ncbi:MAG: tRNA lysidine(34) synthetase TilS [candidate division WOR-3 bacterium]
MIEYLIEIIKKKELLKDVKKVVIGFSGGPDSTFLREVLSTFKGMEIILAYFNHNLREDSEKEEDFVRKEAEKGGYKIKIKECDVRGFCKRNTLSIEEGARELRFAFLREVKEEERADVIALGHTLDDKIENFFIRLLRGSGFGLSQMDYRNGDLFRPLLDIRKKEIVDYLLRKKIPFYSDPTNESLNFLRNRIRKELIPLLEDLKEDAIMSIKRSIDNLRDIEEALRKQIDDVEINTHLTSAEIDRKVFEELPSACKFLVLSKMLSIFGCNLELKRAHLENFPRIGIIKLKNSSIEILPSKVIVAKNLEDEDKELPLSGSLLYGNYRIQTEIVSPPVEFNKNGCEFFDLDALELPILVRGRRKGDYIIGFRSMERKKLKDLFIDNKIPRVLRDRHPVIYDRKGIILVPGIKRSNRAPVEDKTKRILKIKIEEV